MSPSQQQIMEPVQAFVIANTWAEKKSIVEARRDLLLTDADWAAFQVSGLGHGPNGSGRSTGSATGQREET